MPVELRRAKCTTDLVAGGAVGEVGLGDRTGVAVRFNLRRGGDAVVVAPTETPKFLESWGPLTPGLVRLVVREFADAAERDARAPELLGHIDPISLQVATGNLRRHVDELADEQIAAILTGQACECGSCGVPPPARP